MLKPPDILIRCDIAGEPDPSREASSSFPGQANRLGEFLVEPAQAGRGRAEAAAGHIRARVGE